MKLLAWERDGPWLVYRRLEAGTFAVLDRDEINARELYVLLEGIEVVHQRARSVRGLQRHSGMLHPELARTRRSGQPYPLEITLTPAA